MDTDLVITLPRDVLESARMSVEEVKQELALSLYAQGRLSVGKARELAGLSLWSFRQLLAARGVSPHFGVADLEEDLAALRALDRW
jgi:predicted HTH domain antitoxin